MSLAKGPCFRIFPRISTYFRILAWGRGCRVFGLVRGKIYPAEEFFPLPGHRNAFMDKRQCPNYTTLHAFVAGNQEHLLGNQEIKKGRPDIGFFWFLIS